MTAEREQSGRTRPTRGRAAGGPGGGPAGGRDPGRRALLIGGGLGLLTGVGLLADKLDELWTPSPKPATPREPGEVDFAGAHWVAAAAANWRFADRPRDYSVDRIVIHVTEGDYRSTVRAFQDPSHRAATHYVVRRDGQITQLVRELDVAFHAANRTYNEHSIGIEHEGFVTDRSFPEAVYRASARLAAGICARYDFPADRAHLVGHSEVPGADHTDPGPHWDWDHYLRLVRQAGPHRR